MHAHISVRLLWSANLKHASFSKTPCQPRVSLDGYSLHLLKVCRRNLHCAPTYACHLLNIRANGVVHHTNLFENCVLTLPANFHSHIVLQNDIHHKTTCEASSALHKAPRRCNFNTSALAAQEAMQTSQCANYSGMTRTHREACAHLLDGVSPIFWTQAIARVSPQYCLIKNTSILYL